MDTEKGALRLVVAVFLLLTIIRFLAYDESVNVSGVPTPDPFPLLEKNEDTVHHSAGTEDIVATPPPGDPGDPGDPSDPQTREEPVASLDEPVVHVFVINLHSNLDRHFVAQLRINDQPGFAFHHVPAVNGRAIKNGCGGPMDHIGEDVDGSLDLECVTQSHMKALVMGAEYLINDNDFIVVMEDDVSFGLRAFWRHQSLRKIAEGWSETHCDWSLVLLAPWLKDEHWAGMYYHYLTESTNWRLLRKQRGDLFWGAAAYAINTKGIREAFQFMRLTLNSFPVKYHNRTQAPEPFFNLRASNSHFYCSVPRNGGALPPGVNATVLSDCLIFDIVEAPYLSLPPLFVWDSSAIYSSTLHHDHEDAQGQGREKILEFALAVRDLDNYHHRICSVISGFSMAEGQNTGCMHSVDTAVVGVSPTASPLVQLKLPDTRFIRYIKEERRKNKSDFGPELETEPTKEEIAQAKMRYCCRQCEAFDGAEQGSHATTGDGMIAGSFTDATDVDPNLRRSLRQSRSGPAVIAENTSMDLLSLGLSRRRLPANKQSKKTPTVEALTRFYHLDDNKCSLWHMDADMLYCRLWNGQQGSPKSATGHVTGIPEGRCPTQLSNTAVTPRQVCHPGSRLTTDNIIWRRDHPDGTPNTYGLISQDAALEAFQTGKRPVVSVLDFPKALLPQTPKALGTQDIFTEFHSTATCVSRVDQSVSGFRNQTVLPDIPTVDECCFACESVPAANCKAWTYDTKTRRCYVFNRTHLPLSAFYQDAKGFIGGLVTERFCDMSPKALEQPHSFVLPNTDIKGWDIILPGVDQGFFAYSARHCCVLVAAMDEYRLHGWTFDGTWHRCYPKISRVGGTSYADPSRMLTSGILLQGVPKCAQDKCIVSNSNDADQPEPDPKEGLDKNVAFCDGTVDPVKGICVSSRKKKRGYDCRDCMHCHDACQGFLANRNTAYAFNKEEVCQDYLSEFGFCGTTPAHVNHGLDCRGCAIREELYNGKCSHLCQYPERCGRWFSADFQCVPTFIYGSIIADCNKCRWVSDKKGFSVQ